MIISYDKKYFDYLNQNVKEFSVDYLSKENPFLKNYVYLVNDNPVGLISYSLIYDRIELEYIWVSPDFRCRGIASKLIDKMMKENVLNITLEVRSSNTSAINLYKKYSFNIVSVREKYYGSEDAYLMIREMM